MEGSQSPLPSLDTQRTPRPVQVAGGDRQTSTSILKRYQGERTEFAREQFAPLAMANLILVEYKDAVLVPAFVTGTGATMIVLGGVVASGGTAPLILGGIFIGANGAVVLDFGIGLTNSAFGTNIPNFIEIDEPIGPFTTEPHE